MKRRDFTQPAEAAWEPRKFTCTQMNLGNADATSVHRLSAAARASARGADFFNETLRAAAEPPARFQVNPATLEKGECNEIVNTHGRYVLPASLRLPPPERAPSLPSRSLCHSERSEESSVRFAAAACCESPAGFFAPLRMTEAYAPLRVTRFAAVSAIFLFRDRSRSYAPLVATMSAPGLDRVRTLARRGAHVGSTRSEQWRGPVRPQARTGPDKGSTEVALTSAGSRRGAASHRPAVWRGARPLVSRAAPCQRGSAACKSV